MRKYLWTAFICMGLAVLALPAAEITSLAGQMTKDSSVGTIADASAFRETGCYYAFCLEDTAVSRPADRETNGGIFYLPLDGQDGWIRADLTRMRKICALPEDVVPAGMLLADGYLCLTAKEPNDYALLVYRIKGEDLELTQHFSLGQKWTEESEIARPSICAMTTVEGSLLITWSDNGFSFVTLENGQYRLWCSGHFPLNPEENASLSGGYALMESNPFPGSAQCLFDGKRLVLAAFEDYDSLNVLLAVYNESGELYAGLYNHSSMDADSPDGFLQERILPQGRRGFPFEEPLGSSARSGTKSVSPLQLQKTD